MSKDETKPEMETPLPYTCTDVEPFSVGVWYFSLYFRLCPIDSVTLHFISSYPDLSLFCFCFVLVQQ